MDEKSGNKQESKIQNPKSKILIVEDSEIQAIMLKHILVRNGYTVTWQKTGQMGWLRRYNRDLLLLSVIL